MHTIASNTHAKTRLSPTGEGEYRQGKRGRLDFLLRLALWGRDLQTSKTFVKARQLPARLRAPHLPG
jgi:hypothetical protein